MSESSSEQRRHFSFLVYPFRSRPRQTFRPSDGVLTNWRHLWDRLEGDSLARHLDDTFFFLPYIRDLLFPNAPRWPTEQAETFALREKLLKLDPAQTLARTPHDALVRLTFKQSLLATHGPFTLTAPESESKPSVFNIEWIDLLLFPLDIGFLVLKITTAEPDIRTDSVIDLLYDISMIFAPSVDMTVPLWRSADGVEMEGRHFVEFLLQGWTAFRSPAATSLAEFASAIRTRPPSRQYTLGPDGETHGDRFRLFTFLALPTADMENGVAVPFTSSWNRLLYETATLTKLTNPAFYPSESVVDEFSCDIISRWQNWKAAALPEHVIFMARSDAFTLDVLSHNVESDYFNLYLLSLFLKMRLTFFFADLIQRRPSLLRNLFAARRISKAFISFQNEFWFPEVTHKPQGTYLYGRFQTVLRNEALHSELNLKVQNLVSHLEQRYQFVIAVLVALLVGPQTIKGLGEALLWLAQIVDLVGRLH